MLLTRNALGNLLARYRAVLRHCRWKNALAALLLTGMVALPVENLWANEGGHEVDIGGGKWYIGDKGASNNSVIFDDNSIGYDCAAGGHSMYPGGKAENNVLRINSTVESAIGGNVDVSKGVASATNNKLLIEGGTVWRHARGGLAHSIGGSATATGNSLSIESNGKAGTAYGGHAKVTNSGTATATSNALSIKYRGLVMGQAYGGYVEITTSGTATAKNNALTIDGDGKVGGSAYGGYVTISGGTATAKNNALSIKDSGSVGENANPGHENAYGGYASVGDGEGTAMGNTLTIEDGGSVRDNAYGGYVNSFGSGSIITVTGNTVFLNGGSFGAGKRVYGGYARVAGTGNVTDNTVVLGASLKANTLAAVELYGGGYEKSSSGSGTATVSNNTLEVWGHGLTAGAINNFENLYFILPASIKAGDTVLTVTGGAPTKFDTKANVGVAVAAGAQPLKKGDSVTLLRNDKGLHNATTGEPLVQGKDYQKVSLEGKTLKGGQGISLEYDFTLSNTDTTLDATVVDEPKPDPKPTPGGRIRAETKAVVEARAAAAAVLNGAGDLAAGNGIRNALAGFASPQGQSGMASGDATGIAAPLLSG